MSIYSVVPGRVPGVRHTEDSVELKLNCDTICFPQGEDIRPTIKAHVENMGKTFIDYRFSGRDIIAIVEEK